VPRPANSQRSTTTKTSAAAQPTRVPVGGFRNVLEVPNKDPGYYYHWVLAQSDDDGRIAQYKMAGYEMVDAEKHNIPRSNVFSSGQHGSIVRLPCKNGDFMFLMRLKNEFREEDTLAKKQKVDEIEAQIMSPNPEQDLAQYKGTNHTVASSTRWED